MQTYLFVLGHTPQLSLAELKAVAPNQKIEVWSDHLVALALADDQQTQELQQILGGTFKVLRVIQTLANDPDQIIDAVGAYLTQPDKKVLFGITSLNQNPTLVSTTDIKNKLRKMGQKCRYQQSETWGLSTAILSHEAEAFDLFIIAHQEQLFLAQTVAFQDLADWVNRDRNKPYVAGKKGMLPPKLARSLVNLGLGHLTTQADQTPVLYDPFCGSGTILIEGLLRQCEVIGSDIDAEAVAGSLENLTWFEQGYQKKVSYQVFQSDVAHAHQQHWSSKVDLIVTEPFLGKANPKEEQLKNIFTGLRSIYLSAFKTWLKILKPGSVVVIIFPQVTTENRVYNLLELIDKIAEFGYTLQVEPIDYGYQTAIVKRQILVFKYQPQTNNN